MTSPLFTPGSLSRLRRLNLASMKDRAVVEAPTEAAGDDGGAGTGTDTWAPVAGTDVTPAPCRISPAAAGAVATEADQNVALNRWTLTLDVEGPAVGPGYRVTVTGIDVAGDAYTRRLIVLGEHNPRTFAAMRRYACEDAGPGRR
jgi:hypothetical protein